MRVLKFGGSSVANAEAIQQVVRIVEATRADGPLAVVVSALGGVTDTLLDTTTIASRHDPAWEAGWNALRDRHVDVIQTLFGAPEASSTAETLIREIDLRFADLHDLLRGVFLLRECSPRTTDSVSSYGERLSSIVVAAAIDAAGLAAEAVDCRPLVTTDDRFGRARVDLQTTLDRLRGRLLGTQGPGALPGLMPERIPVLTGFVGSTETGQTTTLGRGGSDYTAALAGAAIGAEAIEIWTDVPGVLTADPRLVDGVYTQSHLSYAELMELSHFGAKVVHPPTVHPARLHDIPLEIKNTFAPDRPGTLVTAEAAPANTPIRGIASVPKVALAQLEGDGMVGVPGIAERLFGALAHRGVSAILISQGSSEHSICFAIDEADADATRRAVEDEFELERRLGMVDDLIVEEQHTVVAAVGEQMAHRPGIAGQLFGVLGAYGVNVRAIAQGSSELNISLVVEARDEQRAVRAIHEAFFAPRRCRVDLVIAGVGWVGGALLDQLAEARERLLVDDGLDLRVVAVLSSRKIVVDPEGVDPATAKARLAAEAEQPRETIEASIDDILSTANGAGKIFVDCSASPTLGTRYLGLLENGIAVVAANKKPFSGPQADWDAMRTAERDGGAPLLFETTAGAALPVLGTLRGLRRTGDQVGRIDAVLSGTLNAVLDTLSADVPFSASVRQAFDAGLTEPHPYEDLSGFDVARKLIILARLAGHRLEPDEVDVEPLLTADPWAETDLDTFWQRLPELDAAFEARRAAAAERGCRLRYLATLDLESIEVSAKIAEVDESHPAYALTGPDNLVAIHTARAPASPMVVRGAGAGPAVTAGGVFADLLHASRFDRFPIPRGVPRGLSHGDRG